MAPYLAEFGVILMPICVLQIWAFRKAFTRLPVASVAFGMYGGVTAILCHLMPIHLFGLAETFESVPVILAILYGKRRAGLVAMTLLAGYYATVPLDLSKATQR